MPENESGTLPTRVERNNHRDRIVAAKYQPIFQRGASTALAYKHQSANKNLAHGNLIFAPGAQRKATGTARAPLTVRKAE